MVAPRDGPAKRMSSGTRDDMSAVSSPSDRKREHSVHATIQRASAMTLAVIARGSGLRCVSAPTMIPMPFPLRPARTVLRLTNTRCAAMRYRDGGEWPRPIIDPMKTRLLQADAPGAVEEAAAALG